MQISSRQLSDNFGSNKALIFVSPGRCGTTRIAEILKERLPQEKFAVTHQMPFSRLANIVGNLMYHLGQSEKIKEILYNFIVSRYINGKHFITTDPLTAMVIPQKWVVSDKVCIVQITREPDSFAKSFYCFSRKNPKSFIAHNFVPFWQIGVLPLENILNKKIKIKYRLIKEKKEFFFDSFYSYNPNYIKANVEEIFQFNFIDNLINQFFSQSVHISGENLSIKKNQSK